MKYVFIALIFFIIPLSVFAGGKKETDTAKQVQERQIDSRIPQFIRDAIRNVPEDALIGIGTANLRTLSQSRTLAGTRARAEISRQMDTFIQDMVRDYTASSEVDHSAAISFQENITVALSQSRLRGAAIVNEDTDDRGNYWVVVLMSLDSAVSEVNQAISAAKLAVPAFASFDAEERMNTAFENYSMPEIAFAGE